MDYIFNCTWENDVSFNLYHVVATSHDWCDSWVLAATLTFTWDKGCKVVCAEAEQWSAFFYKSCKSDFSEFSLRNWLTGNRIENLNVNIIIKYMDSFFAWTVDTDTRPVTFSKTINIKKFNAKNIFNTLTHFFTPAFRTDNSFCKVNLVLKSACFNLLCKEECIRGSCTNYS